MTHCRSLKLACSDRCMVGRATCTMVMSTRSMNVAPHTATRVHHWRSVPPSRPWSELGSDPFAATYPPPAGGVALPAAPALRLEERVSFVVGPVSRTRCQASRTGPAGDGQGRR